MAEFNKIHCNLSIVTDSNEDINIRPFTNGNDVYLDLNGDTINAQLLIDKIGKTAYIKNFDGIDDSKGISDIFYGYSINKIKEIAQNTDSIIDTCKQEYSGWF